MEYLSSRLLGHMAPTTFKPMSTTLSVIWNFASIHWSSNLCSVWLCYCCWSTLSHTKSSQRRRHSSSSCLRLHSPLSTSLPSSISTEFSNPVCHLLRTKMKSLSSLKRCADAVLLQKLEQNQKVLLDQTCSNRPTNLQLNQSQNPLSGQHSEAWVSLNASETFPVRWVAVLVHHPNPHRHSVKTYRQ